MISESICYRPLNVPRSGRLVLSKTLQLFLARLVYSLPVRDQSNNPRASNFESSEIRTLSRTDFDIALSPPVPLHPGKVKSSTSALTRAPSDGCAEIALVLVSWALGRGIKLRIEVDALALDVCRTYFENGSTHRG